MSKQFSYKMIFYFLEDKGSDQGFTLIELLVVILFLAVLAILAYPNYIDQTGKARETELKNVAGTINRAQQAYHFERQTFTSDLSFLGVSLPNQYITNSATLITGVSSNAADVQPVNADAVGDRTRAYSGRIAYVAGDYYQVLCRSYDIATMLAVPNTAVGPATTNCAIGVPVN